MEWINVNDERKPPLAEGEDAISVTVLLYAPSFALYQASAVVLGHYLYFSKSFRPSGSHGCEDRVTHWMPLPAPPEA